MKSRASSHFLPFLTLLTLTVTSILISQQSAPCVALITDLRGDVFVKTAQAGEFKKVSWGTQLYDGDIVKTSSTGSVSVLLSNNNLIELGPGSSVTISEGPSALQRKSKTISGLRSKNLIDLSGLTMRSTSEGEMVALSGLRSVSLKPTVVPLEPRNSKVRSITPTFSWRSTASVRKFRVRVFDQDGQLWTKETDKTMLQYPSGEKPLTSGAMYFWQVEGLALVESFPSESTRFSLLSEADLAEVESQERTLSELFQSEPTGSTINFLLGTLYQKYGLLHEAVVKFEAVAQNHSDAPKAFEVLGKLYNDIGFKDKAISALQKALDVSQQQ